MSIIDRATSHYTQQERLIIAVPEWGDESGPLEIHVFPMTMAEVNMMQKIASKKASNIEQAANIILVKAKDSHGKRLFKIEDKQRLMEEVDYRVLERIGEQIESRFFSDIETQKGNSAATSSAATS